MKKIGLAVFFVFLLSFSAWAFPPNTFKDTGVADRCLKMIKALPKQPLSPAEKQGLFHMRQEEKLARDVYFTLFQRWQLRVFYNIYQSEQRHMDMVKLLLDKYGLKDPVEKLGMGYFKDKKLAQLYTQLVRQGMMSFGGAVKVGAQVEEMDIYDLQQEMKKTDNQDIKLLYANLMKASRNHLRIFMRWLQKMGETYTPHYLNPKEFQKIISSPIERGPVDAQGKPLPLTKKKI